jgi:hypothetical protein
MIDQSPEQLVRRDNTVCDPNLGPSRTRDDGLATDPLRDAQALAGMIENLKVLLDLERRLVQAWNAKLYDRTTAGSAAQRLMAVKQSDRR